MDDLKRWRRDLHQIPELGLEETQTTAYLKAELEKIIEAVKSAKALGLHVNAGHGLDYNNVKDIEKWQGNRKEITYKNIETWEILENLRVFYLYKELYTLLSGNFENDDITGKKEFMKKSDFKLVKDLLKDLLLVYNDEEIKFITDKMKNNGNFAESLEKILIFLEKIYIDIRVKYITSIHSLALNYSHYSNSAQLDIIMGINDIFSQNKEDLREFLDRLLLKKKDGIKALKRIIEIKNSIENNVNLKSVISNFFMFYK